MPRKETKKRPRKSPPEAVAVPARAPGEAAKGAQSDAQSDAQLAETAAPPSPIAPTPTKQEGTIDLGQGEIVLPEPHFAPRTTALATVPGSTPVGGKPPWKWTKPKWAALRLTLEGHAPTKIGERIGKHRNTVMNWSNAPEFAAKVRERRSERATVLQLRKEHRSATRAETLYALGDKLIAEAVKPGGKLDVGAVQVVLRGYTEAERLSNEIENGGTVQRVEHNVNIQGGFLGPADGESKPINRAKMGVLEFLRHEGLGEEVKKLLKKPNDEGGGKEEAEDGLAPSPFAVPNREPHRSTITVV